MRWKGRRQSDNFEDRRGQRSKRGMAVGGGGIMAIIMALVAIFVFGQDPVQVLQQATTQSRGGTTSAPAAPPSAAEQEATEFLRVVLADTEDVWNAIFTQSGERYSPPTLVVFSGSTPTACGYGQSATGPFYCPADQKVYIDLSFLSQLQRMGARGDFSVAYVIAHEVGHHIQTVTGVSRQVRAAQSRAGKAEQNALQVRMELQADCYAGVWANLTDRQDNSLEPGDIEEAMSAASAVGDDTIQRNATGRVRPETFTHGSAKQRMDWFQRGYRTGDPNQCNTFET